MLNRNYKQIAQPEIHLIFSNKLIHQESLPHWNFFQAPRDWNGAKMKSSSPVYLFSWNVHKHECKHWKYFTSGQMKAWLLPERKTKERPHHQRRAAFLLPEEMQHSLNNNSFKFTLFWSQGPRGWKPASSGLNALKRQAFRQIFRCFLPF